jgi:hypothetical protein
MIWHILDRCAIHFASATSLVLMLAIAYRYAYRRTQSPWLPHSMPETLVYSGLTLFAASTLREAWDVANGQSVLKAFTDYLSWLLGSGFGVWGLYRWHYFKWEDR